MLLVIFTQSFFAGFFLFGISFGLVFLLESGFNISTEGSSQGILIVFICSKFFETIASIWLLLTPIVAYFEAKEYIAKHTVEPETAEE